MAAVKRLVILLSAIFYVKNAFCQIESTAVLLECGKGSSNDDIKRKIPPYHSIDNCNRKIRITINITNIGKVSLQLIFLSKISPNKLQSRLAKFLAQMSRTGFGTNFFRR